MKKSILSDIDIIWYTLSTWLLYIKIGYYSEITYIINNRVFCCILQIINIANIWNWYYMPTFDWMIDLNKKMYFSNFIMIKIFFLLGNELKLAK